MRETPLKDEHLRLGARMVDFAGWYMPVTYSNIKEEHTRVRTKLGLFDVSHMGRYWFTGPDHIKLIDYLITNCRADMKPGQIRYSLILNEEGGILDDVLCYGAGEEATLLVVNAGNRDVISGWIEKQRKAFNVTFDDRSEDTAMIALQGPESANLLSRVSDVDVKALKYYRFTHGTVFGEPQILVSRTGYTGEDGFELVMPAAKAAHFWRELLHIGGVIGAGPAGLGCRDTLRLEAGMPLHGHEIDASTNPLEAGLDWAVRLDKGEFIGRAATMRLKEGGLKRKLVGLHVEGKRIPRQGQEVLKNGGPVGVVCSGTLAPWLDQIIATAYVPADGAEVGAAYQVEFKGKASKKVDPEESRFKAVVVPLPFYKRPGKK